MSDYLDVAIEAAKAGGAVAMKYYQQNPEISQKADGSVVTNADKEAEVAIIDAIKKHFPEHAFLGEEGGAHGTSEYVWILDPIDGTNQFSRGMPQFSTLIALMKGEEILLGVSYAPVEDVLIHAERDEGCFINGEQVYVSGTKDLSQVYGLHDYLKGFVKGGTEQKLLSLLPRLNNLDVMAARDAYPMVFRGLADVMLTDGVAPWDVIAWSIMVEEAGGNASDMQGNPIGKNSTSIIASNKILHQTFVKHFS